VQHCSLAQDQSLALATKQLDPIKQPRVVNNLVPWDHGTMRLHLSEYQKGPCVCSDGQTSSHSRAQVKSSHAWYHGVRCTEQPTTSGGRYVGLPTERIGPQKGIRTRARNELSLYAFAGLIRPVCTLSAIPHGAAQLQLGSWRVRGPAAQALLQYGTMVHASKRRP
jgi:hypothetical protein